MGNTAVSSWKDFFYKEDELKHEKHGKHIKATNAETGRNLRYFQTLIGLVFSSHMTTNPNPVDLKSLRFNVPESIELFRREDIDNLFITQYYKYPNIFRLNTEDIHQVLEEISTEDVFDEIKEQIAGPSGIVALLGDVGEGKSTFLSKLALELKTGKSEQKYYPVIIDLQKYNHLLETEYKIDIPKRFWRIVCQHIASCLQEDLDLLVASIITDQIGKETGSNIELKAFFSAIIASLKGEYFDRVSKKHTEESSKVIEPYHQIVKAANKLITKHNIRLVLIFDNLDTYCSEHERFMLFTSSWQKLETKIRIVRDIFWGVTDRFLDSEMSLIFTARPYVYTHAFQSELHENRNERINSLYSLGEVIPSLPIDLRFQMLIDLAKLLTTSKQIPPGKQKAIEPYINGFTSFLDGMSNYSKEPLNKFYSVSNQGFRSMVNFFRNLHHDRNLFERYYTHDILYLYLLSRRSLYSQVPPDEQSPKPVSHFPNMFLISCDNYWNNRNREACQPHHLTYWLKYLMLAIVHRRNRVNIRYILDMLSSYDNHAVRLCLGSLSTANETNCLNLEFPPEIVSCYSSPEGIL